jgi:arylsulfatase
MIAADLEIPTDGAEGVIVAEADVMGGFALYVQGGKLHYTYSFLGLKVETLTSSEILPAGKADVRYEFTADKSGQIGTGGRGRLFVNGKQVGENRMEHSVPLRFSSYSGMDIGKDNGEPVSPTYKARSPFPFTGRIGKVIFDLTPQGSQR